MLLAALFLASGGGPAPVTADVPDEPAGFSDPLAIDNPYHPFVKFRLRLYALTDGGEYAIDDFRPETRTFDVSFTRESSSRRCSRSSRTTSA